MTQVAPLQVVCLGEALIDLMPAQKGQYLSEARLLVRAAGGAAANVTVGLARLGVASAFLGKVGTDPLGNFLRKTLLTESVDVSHLYQSPEANTGLAFAWTEATAAGANEARFLFYRQPSADRFLSPAEIDRDWLAQARVLQFGSLLLASEPSASAVRTALETAQHANLLVCYDVNMRLPAFENAAVARQKMLEPLEFCGVVKLNRHELTFLTGESGPEQGAAKLWRSGLKLMVVTLDREGCYFKVKDDAGFCSGFEVTVADPIGAGDGFMAGLLAKLLEQPDFAFKSHSTLVEACRFANAVGALTCTKAGAIPALPTLKAVKRLLKTTQIAPNFT